MCPDGSATTTSVSHRTARTILHGARRLVHPLVHSFLPVEYLPGEVATRKHRLDPSRSRHRRDANPETGERIGQLGALLGLTGEEASERLEEARRFRPVDLPANQTADLASPMCFEDCCAVYVATRAIRPEKVIETGVANGSSSAFILAALEANGCGELVSVELSPDERIGQVIPPSLRHRWSLHRGDSLAVLPKLIAEHGPCCMFVHDSCHRYRHMRREYELAWPHIRPGGVLCSHDTLTTNAFPRFLRHHRREIDGWIVNVNFGAARKRAS